MTGRVHPPSQCPIAIAAPGNAAAAVAEIDAGGASPRGRRNPVRVQPRRRERGCISAWAEEPPHGGTQGPWLRVHLRVGGGTTATLCRGGWTDFRGMFGVAVRMAMFGHCWSASAMASGLQFSMSLPPSGARGSTCRLGSIVSRVTRREICSAVNRNPIGVVYASCVSIRRARWKRAGQVDPPLLFAGDHAHFHLRPRTGLDLG